MTQRLRQVLTMNHELSRVGGGCVLSTGYKARGGRYNRAVTRDVSGRGEVVTGGKVNLNLLGTFQGMLSRWGHSDQWKGMSRINSRALKQSLRRYFPTSLCDVSCPRALPRPPGSPELPRTRCVTCWVFVLGMERIFLAITHFFS